MVDIMKDKKQKPVALVLFLFSGLLSLIFQVVWLKKLVLVFGNTVWAVSTLLTAFMAGLAIGSWLFGRIADRSGSPLKLYGILEGFIGSYGILTLLILGKLYILYVPLYAFSGGDNLLMGIFKFLMALLILLPPTICMGGTLPLLARHFTEDMSTASSNIGVLYTINTFGAVCGTFIAGFILIPELGLRITGLIASCISFAILAVSLMVTKGENTSFKREGLLRIHRKKLERHWMLWVYCVCGFAALAYEVIWNRVLVLHIGSSVYAYSVLLAVYLLGVTLGSAMMSYYVERLKHPILVFAIIQIIIAFDLIFLINQFDMLAENLAVMERIIGIHGHWSHIVFLVIGVFQILILPTMLFGASFPVAVKLFVKTHKELGQETGLLYAFNTVGNILGSFCAGFLLLPLLGSQRGLLFVASLNLLAGVYLITKIEALRLTKTLASAGIMLLFYGGYLSFTYHDQVILTAGVFRDTDQRKVKLLSFEEDVYATVAVEERVDGRGTWKQLSMNGVNVAGTSSELFSIQKLQGHLPLLLHANPKTVLHIGFGSGGTAYAVSRYPVEKIMVAEISKSVIKEASDYFQEVNHGVLNDPRVTVEFTDGRNKVLASTEKYDVILSDSIHPRFSGNGSLYTSEYYQLLKDRLKPGGVVSQWLPFYSLTLENFKMIVKSFYEVFPNTSIWFPNSTINAYTIVIGKLNGPMIDYPIMEARLKIPEVAADLKEINADTPYKILDFFFFANEKVREFVDHVPLHTDDNMAVEYLSGKVISKWESSYVNYKELLHYRTSVKDYLVNVEKAAENRKVILETLDRYETATTYNLTGQLLFWEGKPLEAFRQFDMIPQLNPEDLEPVEYFGASYQKPFLKNAVPWQD
jgi:spermidine synthase